MRKHSAFESNPYQAKPEPLSALAPTLGLPSDSGEQQTKDALSALITKARGTPLGDDASKSLQLVEEATKPKPGYLDFSEVRLVAFEGNVKTLCDVERAVEIIRKALETSESSTTSCAATTSAELSTLVTPPYRRGVKHVSSIVQYVLNRYRVEEDS